MIVVTRTSRFTRGFVKVTKSAHTREFGVATAAFVVTSSTAFSSCFLFPIPYSLFPIPYSFDFPAGFAHLAKHPIFHPLLVPPLDRVDRVAVDEHREVEMIAAGQTRHPRAADLLALRDRVADLHFERREVRVQRLHA